MKENRGLKSSLFVYNLSNYKCLKGVQVEYIKGIISEYDEIIYRLITAMLWLGIGGMIGYMMGMLDMFRLVGWLSASLLLCVKTNRIACKAVVCIWSVVRLVYIK